MATRKSKTAAKPRTPKGTAADGVVDVQATETVTETPVGCVIKDEADTQSAVPAPQEAAFTKEIGSTIPDATIPDATIPDATIPDATIPDATIPDATALDASEKMNPGSPGVIKTITPTVEGLDENDLDLSKLTAVINPDRSGYDGVLKQNDRIIANIDCGPESASAADIKADIMAAGMPEKNIQIFRD